MINTSVKTEGFEGILFPGNGSKEKVLIVMSGSDGGMSFRHLRWDYPTDNSKNSPILLGGGMNCYMFFIHICLTPF